MNRFFCSLLIAGTCCVEGRAEYQIGQSGIPAPLVHENVADFRVYGRHPRLFFRDTDLLEIRKRIAGDFAPEWEALVAQLDRNVLPKPAATFAEGVFLKRWEHGRNVAFAALVTGEPRYVRWAKEWAQALVSSGPEGNDDRQRGRLQSLAVAYDWLYSEFSDEERNAVADAIVAHLDSLWYFANRSTNYVSGHSRWGNMTLAAGLLAIVTERPEMKERLMVVRDHWVNGYFPLQGWIAKDGGYHMGWAYSAAYLSGSIHNLWSSATNESVYYPWQALTPLFWQYGRQGDDTYPNTGDAYTVTSDLNAPAPRALLLIAAGVLKDRRAAGQLRKGSDFFFDILYGDKRVKPLAADDSVSPLPLSRHFRNSGVVVARDEWGPGTTLLQFRSVPFYSANHHHRDENSFTLHYRGGLAIDSGFYDKYGSPHWLNYFSRTIAHNAIVVFDPAQEMKFERTPISNDGGQPYRKEPGRLEQLLPGGEAALGGITVYQDTDDYTYMVGDASKAYDPERVALAQREIVYLRGTDRPHPVVIVFDRVESTDAAFKKTFLLHTANEPVVCGNVSVAENQGGRLSCVTVLPAKPRLELVGGAGREAWVDGKNYLWQEGSPKLATYETGKWRLEVSPTKPAKRDDFLHVLFVDDVGATPVDSASVQRIEVKGGMGVRVAGWEIIFPHTTGGRAIIRKADAQRLAANR